MKIPMTAASGGNAGTHREGQIAVMFLVIIAFSLTLIWLMVDLYANAKAKVETSNASDAAALSAASWMASGQNEADDLSRKMNESLQVVQGAYQTNVFCPGDAQANYAQTLWQSLLVNPHHAGKCQGANPADYWNCGPTRFFQTVANGAMTAAWNEGRAAFLLSAVNNMTIDAPGSNLPQAIRDELVALKANRPVSFPLRMTWQSGSMAYDARFTLEGYPSSPPTVNMTNRQQTFRQYQAPVLADQDGNPATPPVYVCPDGEWAKDVNLLRKPCLNYANDAGPLMEAQHIPICTVTLNDGARATLPCPLAVAANGKKRWEEVMPALDASLQTDLVPACRPWVEQSTASLPVAPGDIHDGTGVATVTVSYTVTDKSVPDKPKTVVSLTSGASASYSTPTAGAQNASARLVSVQ